MCFVEETSDQERTLGDLIVRYDSLEVQPLDDGTRHVECIVGDVVVAEVRVYWPDGETTLLWARTLADAPASRARA